MSAFIVSKVHIDAMVRLAIVYSPSYAIPYGDIGEVRLHPDEVGRAILAENVASVTHRYPDDKPEELPGPNGAYWLGEYLYSPLGGRTPTPIEGLKLINCYEYQSCEHPEWESSKAKEFCDRLRHQLISLLPGYDEAPWDWSE